MATGVGLPPSIPAPDLACPVTNGPLGFKKSNALIQVSSGNRRYHAGGWCTEEEGQTIPPWAVIIPVRVEFESRPGLARLL
jgi:hypothetical protein